MRRAMAGWAMLLAAVGAGAGGCGDAYFATAQRVELSVRERGSLRPVENATVTVAPVDVHQYPNQTLDDALDALASVQVNTARTDAQGKAIVWVNTSIIKGGLFDNREPLTDRVTGCEYLTRVTVQRQEPGHSVRTLRSEIIKTPMNVPSQSQGDEFVVCPLSIGAPVEMKGDYAAGREGQQDGKR